MAQAFWDDHWGDLASVAGLIVSLVGFFWTILAALGAKNAAKQAREAARQARDRVLHIDGFSQFTEALTVMEEVKRLHRAQAWATALERYGTLRRLLISVRSASAGWPAEHKAALTGAIQQFTEMEKLVEEATQRGNKFPKFARLNGIITHERDKLAEVLDQSKHLLVEK